MSLGGLSGAFPFLDLVPDRTWVVFDVLADCWGSCDDISCEKKIRAIKLVGTSDAKLKLTNVTVSF